MRVPALITIALVVVGCDFQQQRGTWNPMEDERTGQPAGSGQTSSAADTEPASGDEEEFQLMQAYSDDDLNAISGFVEWNVAIDVLRDSLEEGNHPRQGIKTAPLYGGIALLTTTNSAYWYKEEVLYTANPYAAAYSPELPKAPDEITHDAVVKAIKKRERAQRNANGNIEVTRADRIDAAFGEFVALVNYANEKIDGADYSTAFLDEVEVPITAETMISTINKFNEVLDTIGQDHPNEYEGLAIDQSQLLYTYGRISNGMTLDQVERLLGGKGENFDSVATSTGQYNAYAWRGFAGTNVFVFFREGTVFDKVATGLV